MIFPSQLFLLDYRGFPAAGLHHDQHQVALSRNRDKPMATPKSSGLQFTSTAKTSFSILFKPQYGNFGVFSVQK